MILFTAGQIVMYNDRLWEITGFKEVDGKTKHCLKRGPYTEEADETEIEAWSPKR